DRVRADDYQGAYALIAPSSNVDFATAHRDIAGRDGSLKTLSQLQNADTRVIANHGNEALVRASLEWRTAVGELFENKDLKLRSDRVRADDYQGAYALIAPSSNVDFATAHRDIAGRDGSLKTLSQLQNADTRVIANHGNEALVRASLEWRTAVGELFENKDLKL